MSEMMNNKKKKKRVHLSKRGKKFFKGINRIYWVFILSVVAVLGFFVVSVSTQYKNTTKWEKNPNEVPMASQSLDLLYDKDASSRKNKANFTALRKTLINENGSLSHSINVSKVKELKSYLDKIDTKSSEVNYPKEYAEIAIKYSLLNKYSDLFKDSGNRVLKDKVTPLTIAKLNDESFNNLKDFYTDNPNDSFVQEYNEKLAPLINDVEEFNNIVNLFDSRVTQGVNSVSLVNGYNGNLMKEFNGEKTKLNLDWGSTKYMNDVVKLLVPINSKVNNLYDSYSKYEADQEEKRKALATWEANKAEFFQAVEAIHQQAVNEKHEKERIERLKKELEEGIVRATSEVNQLTDIKSNDKNDIINRIKNAQTIDEVNNLLNLANQKDKEEKENKAKELEENKNKEKDKDKDKDKGNPTTPPKPSTPSSSTEGPKSQ